MTRRSVVTATMAILLLATLGAAASVSSARPDAEVRRDSRRYEIELQRQIDDLQAQMTQLKAKQRELVARLEAIADQAKKERAGETARQVQQLIEQTNSSYAAERKDLERKLGRFQKLAQKMDRRQRLEKNVGSRARGFTLKDAQGKDVSLNAYKGKVIVLEWVNPECPYSRYYYDDRKNERKTVPRLVKQYEDKGVVWLSINSTMNATAKQNKAFAKRYGVTHPILNDATGMVARTYGARKTPHVFIIDRKGVIAYNGGIDDSPASVSKQRQVNSYVEKALAQLLAEKPVSMPYSEVIGSPLGRNL